MPVIPNLSEVAASSSDESNLLAEHVPAEGSPSYARFTLVGEAPGGTEMSEKKPFCGPAGNVLNRILNVLGIPRHQLYITNVCKTKLPGNDSKKLKPVWEELRHKLIQELSQVSSEYIVLLGETAMKAVIGDSRFDSVTKFQGSVYEASDFQHLAEPLKGKKLMVTFHPASALPSAKPTNFYVIMHDFQKLLDLEANPELLADRNITHIEPSFPHAMEFLSEVAASSETAFDIEATPSLVTCFGFTLTPHEAMCIPMMTNTGSYWSPEQELEIWKLTAQILESSSVGLIGQNLMFDMMFMLRTMRIKSENLAFDTMLARHLAWADLSKGLDAIVSCYTYYPYYKDEGKQTHLKLIKDWPQHWAYNAKDCLYTHQVVDPLKKELQDFGAIDTYNHLLQLHKPLMEMEFRGIRVDLEGMTKMRDKLYRKSHALNHGLKKIAGKPLNHRSAPQMKKYFYEDLNLKPYINRKTGKPTLDDMALKRISRAGKKGSVEARLIRNIRKTDKLLSSYFEVSLDADSRLRCGYKISGTSTGRLSSSATFFGTGTNLQNQPKLFKKYLTPDPGHLLIEIDLSQAEARVVAYVSGDANMIQSFESGIDCHSYNACQIFSREMPEFLEALQRGDSRAKEQRNLAKRIVHASNYDMGYKTFALQIEEPENRAKSLLEAYHRRFPGLKAWHRQIDQQIHRNRTLHNLHGRPKRFLGNLDHNLAKAAYAYIPQSTVAEQLNRGLVRLYEDPELNKFDFHFLATVHDSVLLQFKETDTTSVASFLSRANELLDIPLHASGREFRIPCDAKISFSNWKDMIELKSFSHAEISNALEKLNEESR